MEKKGGEEATTKGGATNNKLGKTGSSQGTGSAQKTHNAPQRSTVTPVIRKVRSGSKVEKTAPVAEQSGGATSVCGTPKPEEARPESSTRPSQIQQRPSQENREARNKSTQRKQSRSVLGSQLYLWRLNQSVRLILLEYTETPYMQGKI